MSIPSEIAKLVEEIYQYAANFHEIFQGFIQEHDLEWLLQENHIAVLEKTEDLGRSIKQLHETWPDGASRAARQAVTARLALDAQLMLFETQLDVKMVVKQVGQKIVQAVQSAWQSLKKLIQPLLNALNSSLQQLLANLPNLENWSVAGDAGVSLFGLQGNVTLELTFGP